MTDPTDDTPDLARAVDAVGAFLMQDDTRRLMAQEYLADRNDYHGQDLTRHANAMAAALRAALATFAHRPDRATQPTEAALTWEGCETTACRFYKPESPCCGLAGIGAVPRTCVHCGVTSRLIDCPGHPARTQPTAEPRCSHGSTLTELCEAFQVAPNDPHPEPRTVETDEREAHGSYCPPGCKWPHDHRFEADGKPWPTHEQFRSRVPARADDPTGGA